jgi:hypothetical protein
LSENPSGYSPDHSTGLAGPVGLELEAIAAD